MGPAFALEPFLQPLLVQFGVLTLIFSLAEKHTARVPDAWNRKNGVARKEAKPTERLPLLDSIARKIIGRESSEVSRLESVATSVLVSLAIL
ncbi:MAG: hypothetical protein LAP21_14190 [Acidobacteriia bacterium]|nr:hypothetical protein [Terriglobia bacterium]